MMHYEPTTYSTDTPYITISHPHQQTLPQRCPVRSKSPDIYTVWISTSTLDPLQTEPKPAGPTPTAAAERASQAVAVIPIGIVRQRAANSTLVIKSRIPTCPCADDMCLRGINHSYRPQK